MHNGDMSGRMTALIRGFISQTMQRILIAFRNMNILHEYMTVNLTKAPHFVTQSLISLDAK
jgi:hypothetical protein